MLVECVSFLVQYRYAKIMVLWLARHWHTKQVIRKYSRIRRLETAPIMVINLFSTTNNLFSTTNFRLVLA